MNHVISENQKQCNGNIGNIEAIKNPLANEKGGIAIPAVMWFMGVPFFLVVLLWLFFFRG